MNDLSATRSPVDPARQGPGPGRKPDNRRSRSPETLHAVELVIRGLEFAVVVFAGLCTTYFTYELFDLGGARPYVQAIWLSGIVFALAAEFAGAYDADSRFSLRTGWTRILLSWTGGCIFLILVAFLLRSSQDFSRSWSLAAYFAVLFSLLVVRTIGTLLLLRIKRTGVFDQRVAIFGDDAQRISLCNQLHQQKDLTIEIVGCYGPHPAHVVTDGPQAYRGDETRLVRDVRQGRVDQVIIALPFSQPEVHRDLVRELSTMPVLIRLFPDLGGYAFSGQTLVVLGGVPLATLFHKPINGADVVWKRAEDIVLGVLLLMVAAPALAIIALLIKLDSPGPVFFRQRREGFNTQSFWIWKLRTMHVATLEHDAIVQVRKGDDRVTRVGRLLRKTSLDELPQLLNVLRGDMSLVGPRPHAPSTRVKGVLFHEAVQNYAARHRVKPGMTGWAQVHGWRGETDTDQKLQSRVEHDLFYIEHWSIGFDVYILFRTIGAVLFPRHAY